MTEGEASFNSELQNDPIDPESATFNEEWFDYYEPEQVDFKSSNFIFVGANDPSLGKNKKSDTSGIMLSHWIWLLDICMPLKLRLKRENRMS